MASTPSSRLRLTPSNSPSLPRTGRLPARARPGHESRLNLSRVVGTTCASPTGFDTVQSSFAYIAGGAVVVVDVQGETYAQRFYRARPAAVPVFPVSQVAKRPSTPVSTPKANDSRNRAAASSRDSPYGTPDWPDSPSKTWTSRERIKAATCLGLSRDGRYLAVGETGYAPRVLIFSLGEASSDVPLVSISEHTFGVNALAWSPDTKFLASLGAANDGYLYMWRIDAKTGCARLFRQNRCTSNVKGMVWMGSSLITFGVRHVKVWRAEEVTIVSQTKSKSAGDGSFPSPAQTPRSLPGRNILLGSLLEATFSCAVAIDDSRAFICTETGDVCLLDETNKQMKLSRVLELGFVITCISLRGETTFIGGKAGEFARASTDAILRGQGDAVVHVADAANGFLAMGTLTGNLVTIDAKRSVDIWGPDRVPAQVAADEGRISIPGHGDPIVGIQRLGRPNLVQADFFTWSGAGRVQLWTTDGSVKSSFEIPIEDVDTRQDGDPVNQLLTVRATDCGRMFFAGDKLGVLRAFDFQQKEWMMETKAHASDCQTISIYEDASRVLLASCGRDRTAQLFYRSSSGSFEHFQTLEFAAKVVQVLIPTRDKMLTCSLDRTLQVHDLVTKDEEPDTMAAVLLRVVSLKASPSSMVMDQDGNSIYVSLLDRSICRFDMSTGRQINSFKCTDETGHESVVLESLIYSQLERNTDVGFLLGISNTDKSVRIYDTQAGSFLDREWGHTEAINGVILLQDVDETRQRVVSVGSDRTIMIWTLHLLKGVGRALSPGKGASAQPTLRKVISKADLAEFERPTSSSESRPRLQRKTSRPNLSSFATRTPRPENHMSPTLTIREDSISPRSMRRTSSDDSSLPTVSLKDRRRLFKRPSLPVLMTPSSSGSVRSTSTAAVTRKRQSSSNLRDSSSDGNGGSGAGYGFGSLGSATEQTCRQLRAYRRKLAGASSTELVDANVLAALVTELRLTATALGEYAVGSRVQLPRRRARTDDQDQEDNEEGEDVRAAKDAAIAAVISEMTRNGFVDRCSERIMSMLASRFGLPPPAAREVDGNGHGNKDDGKKKPEQLLGDIVGLCVRDGDFDTPTVGEMSSVSSCDLDV